MDTKLYLTIAAVVAMLYAIGFLIIPVQASLFFSGFAEPRAVLNLRFCGAAVLAWGLIVWFARDFQDWFAVNSVLIASIVGLAADIIINVWATLQGWLNINAWGVDGCAGVADAWGRLSTLGPRATDDKLKTQCGASNLDADLCAPIKVMCANKHVWRAP